MYYPFKQLDAKVKLGSHCDIRLKWWWVNNQGSSGGFEGSKSEVESVYLHLSVILKEDQFSWGFKQCTS